MSTVAEADVVAQELALEDLTGCARSRRPADAPLTVVSRARAGRRLRRTGQRCASSRGTPRGVVPGR
ncbi:hypothetical protein [Streptomyces sp. NBC_00005]|uniref:hypothetical protein n=1 Tax=Streptomyces sp. NBC_00005 TaxID=2903609 RepID=UPI003252A341